MKTRQSYIWVTVHLCAASVFFCFFLGGGRFFSKANNENDQSTAYRFPFLCARVWSRERSRLRKRQTRFRPRDTPEWSMHHPTASPSISLPTVTNSIKNGPQAALACVAGNASSCQKFFSKATLSWFRKFCHRAQSIIRKVQFFYKNKTSCETTTRRLNELQFLNCWLRADETTFTSDFTALKTNKQAPVCTGPGCDVSCLIQREEIVYSGRYYGTLFWGVYSGRYYRTLFWGRSCRWSLTIRKLLKYAIALWLYIKFYNCQRCTKSQWSSL